MFICLDQLSLWLLKLFFILELEPLWAEFFGDGVLLGVPEWVDFLKCRKDVTLDNCSCVPFMSLLGLTDLVLELTVAHIRIVSLEQSSLLFFLPILLIEMDIVKVKDLPSDGRDIEFFEDLAQFVFGQVVA